MRYAIIGAGWLWGLAALPQVTDAVIEFEWFFLLPLGGGLIGLLWVVYSLSVPSVFRSSRVRWLWCSVPLIGVGGALLSQTQRDLAVRVWLCDSELREYAESVRQNPGAAHASHQRVGLFEVRHAHSDGQEVSLYTASSFFDFAGIVYRPDGAPPEYCRHYQHLYGPWWWFWEDF